MSECKDRYFYIPAAAVKAEVDAIMLQYEEFQKRIDAFLKEMGTTYYRTNNKRDAILQIGYRPEMKIPEGLRIIDETQIDDQTIKIAVPDKRTKAGKIIAKKLRELNEKGISLYAPLQAAASRYKLDIDICFQNYRVRDFYGKYISAEDAYLIGVPSGEGDGTLKDDTVIPHFEEITELKEWEYIAISNGDKTLKELRKEI